MNLSTCADSNTNKKNPKLVSLFLGGVGGGGGGGRGGVKDEDEDHHHHHARMPPKDCRQNPQITKHFIIGKTFLKKGVS